MGAQLSNGYHSIREPRQEVRKSCNELCLEYILWTLWIVGFAFIALLIALTCVLCYQVLCLLWSMRGFLGWEWLTFLSLMIVVLAFLCARVMVEVVIEFITSYLNRIALHQEERRRLEEERRRLEEERRRLEEERRRLEEERQKFNSKMQSIFSIHDPHIRAVEFMLAGFHYLSQNQSSFRFLWNRNYPPQRKFALRFFEEAGKLGHPFAYYNVAVIYHHHSPNDTELAKLYYQRCIDEGTFGSLAKIKLTQLRNENSVVLVDYEVLENDQRINWQQILASFKHGDIAVGLFSIIGNKAEHWAIYDKEQNVFIELTGTAVDDSMKKGGLRWFSGLGPFATVRTRKPVDFFTKDWSRTGKVKWSNIDRGMEMLRAAAVKEARLSIGKPLSYALLPLLTEKNASTPSIDRNCESFIRECFIGVPISSQGDRFRQRLRSHHRSWLGDSLLRANFDCLTYDD